MSVEITYLVHGATLDNEQDIASGWANPELSELGIKQAKQQGDLLVGKHFDIVFCSDLKRAVESADLAFKGKVEIIQDNRLRECNYGDFNQKPDKTFKHEVLKYIDTPFPNGESYEDVKARIQNLLKFIKANYNDKHVVLLAHQAPQLALDVLLKGKTWKQAIDEDWRKTKSWQPGWEYELK